MLAGRSSWKLLSEPDRAAAVNDLGGRILEPVFVRDDGALDGMDQEGAMGDEIDPIARPWLPR